jgi:hypothetical protein
MTHEGVIDGILLFKIYYSHNALFIQFVSLSGKPIAPTH